MRNTGRYYSVKDIQEILGVGRATTYRLVRSKGFPSITIGKQILIDKEAFVDWQRNQLGRRVRLG